jgi:uncharacterized cupredoxin-like copper-binding protein
MSRFAWLATAALLAGCASSRPIEPRIAPPTATFSGAAAQRIELASFDFTPREIRLHAGRPYDLVLVNVSSGDHDFAAPEFFAAALVKADDASMIARGKIDVPGSATRTIRLIPAAGRYKLVCTHAGHALLGMTGTIVVE